MYATYSWQLNATVTALWRSTSFLDVKVSEGATGSLDDTGLVGLGVGWVAASVDESVGRHFE